AMDGARYSAFNFFRDLREGAGILDSLTKALDNFADALFDVISQQLIEGWLGKAGTTGKGSWLGGLIGSFFGFGGGKATGGWAAANSMYQVNERGFEMATVGGNDYLLTGPRPVHITQSSQLRGGGGVNQTFIVQGVIDQRTRAQLEQQTGTAARRALARNG